jgi:hypothetical protein
MGWKAAMNMHASHKDAATSQLLHAHRMHACSPFDVLPECCSGLHPVRSLQRN